MKLTPQQKKVIADKYTGWAEAWGLALAYSVTQSVEKSESAVADAIVALVATETDQLVTFRDNTGTNESTVAAQSVVKFAGALWEFANRKAFRGYTTDPFFRLPAITRAIVVLRAKAQFTASQIAQAVSLRPDRVQDHLENARLLFSDGKSWVSPAHIKSMDAALVGAFEGAAASHHSQQTQAWTAQCPQAAKHADIQNLFAQYVGNDMSVDETQRLHNHLTDCASCRTGFTNFKKQYSDWVDSVPVIEADGATRKHLSGVTHMALRMQRRNKPSPWPGIRSVLADSQVQAAFFLGALASALHLIFSRH